MSDHIKSIFRDKIPPFKKWRLLPRVLNNKERVIFFTALVVFFVSLILCSTSFYLSKTERIPAYGGSYSEGMVGYPRFLNPIYSSTSDVDRDMTTLLFSGLLSYDFTRGFIPNLMEDITEDGGVFKIRLKDNLKWSDGEKITARDVIFTVKAIQDPEYRSPLRPDWIGVKIKEISELEVEFQLEQPSMAFINKLSLKLIPSHIWEEIPPQNFPLSRYNLDPVGSGPYRVKETVEDRSGNITSFILERNPYYHGKKPYIEEIKLDFFENEKELMIAAKRGDIDGFSAITPKDYREVISMTGFQAYRFQMPRYFAIFFNLDNEDINRDMRFALDLAVKKNIVIENALAGRGQKVYSPVLPQIYKLDIEEINEFNPEKAEDILESMGLKLRNNGFRSKVIREAFSFSFEEDLSSSSQGEEVRALQNCLIFLTEEDPDIFPDGKVTGFYGQDTREAVNRFQEKYREEILDPGGFKRGTGMVAESTRAKLNEICTEIPEEVIEPIITITTVDQPLMIQTAEEVKNQWEAIGVRTDIAIYDRTSLERDVIKPRNYDMLLFGKAFEAIPDLFPFWHSSQKSEFGLNLSMYENEGADSLIEQLRTETNKEERSLILKEINNLIIEDVPAIFLYNPDYLYFISSRISGVSPGRIINPSNRFLNIENWYIKTKKSITKER